MRVKEDIEVKDESDDHGIIIMLVGLAFIGLLFLIVFQFALHHSQTKDLQRRVGTIESRMK